MDDDGNIHCELEYAFGNKLSKRGTHVSACVCVGVLSVCLVCVRVTVCCLVCASCASCVCHGFGMCTCACVQSRVETVEPSTCHMSHVIMSSCDILTDIKKDW